MMESKSTSRDIIIAAGGAIIPAFLTALVSLAISYFVPSNEIRIMQSQIDNKVLYLNIENHSYGALGPIKFVIRNVSKLGVISSSAFAKVDISEDSTKQNALLSVSELPPHRQTSILIGAADALTEDNFEATSLPTNTVLVSSRNLSSVSISNTFISNIILQSILYFAFFFFLTIFDRRNKATHREMERKLEEAKAEVTAAQDKSEATAAKLHTQIKKIEAVSAKYRIYTRRIYGNVDRENKFWRNLIKSSFVNALATKKEVSEEIVRNILRRSGIKRISSVPDMDIELLVAALQTDDEELLQIAGQGAVDKEEASEMPDPY